MLTYKLDLVERLRKLESYQSKFVEAVQKLEVFTIKTQRFSEEWMVLKKGYKKVERLSKFIKGKPTSLPKLRVFFKVSRVFKNV